MRPNRSQLAELYGPIVGDVWAEQAHWMMSIPVPEWLRPHWRYRSLKVNTIYAHKIMAKPLGAAFDLIAARDLANRIHSFDGCFTIRTSRRGQRQSVHSWGLAIDLNAAENPMGAQPTICRKLVSVFEEAGFVWGGTWAEPDGMHLQYVTEDK